MNSLFNGCPLELSKQIEDLLVARNLRGMQQLQPNLSVGYCHRAANILADVKGTVLIGTGFPVANTFETDGPVGALILYRALEILGANPIVVCGDPIAEKLSKKFNVFRLPLGNPEDGEAMAKQALATLQPEVVISIERPGLADNGRYHNMRGEDITARTACFDYFLTASTCPTIAIGDGGNEIGMGNLTLALSELDIIASTTPCDELIIADVSNWGVYGILAFLSIYSQHDLLTETCPHDILVYLSDLGSVDGVTRKNHLTEDSLPSHEGKQLIADIRSLIGFNR